MPRSDPAPDRPPFPNPIATCVACGRLAGLRESPLWLVRQATRADDDQLDCICSWRCLQDFAAAQLGSAPPKLVTDQLYAQQLSDESR